MIGPLKVFLRSPYLYGLVRTGLGLVFVWAGGVKLMDPRGFARVLSNYPMIPDELLAPLAIGLPLVEVLAGAGLVFHLRGSLTAIFTMLCVFLLTLAIGVYHNLDIDCGCFSPEEIHARNGLRDALLRDFGFLACTVYLFFWKRAKAGESTEGFSRDSTQLKRRNWSDEETS